MKSVSVLTPSWNRLNGLKKLYQSLVEQSYSELNWVVADDGSTDGSLEYLQYLRGHRLINVRVIHSDRRVGKAALDNLLLQSVVTDVFVFCDSDDYFLFESIPKVMRMFENTPSTPIDVIFAPNISTDNKDQTFYKNTLEHEGSAFDLHQNLTGDATFFMRSSMAKLIRFPEVDFMIPEWIGYRNVFRDKNGVWYPDYVKQMDRSWTNSISNSKGIKYCRGMAYSHAEATTLAFQNETFKLTQQIKMIINFSRYVVNGELGFNFYYTRIKKFGVLKRFILVGAYILSYPLVIRDIYFGGLVYTHREFEANRSTASIVELYR
jgi:glycosyltransferase involved in cell wall biosynthesis